MTAKIIAYASSERLNALLSAAQYENALPKNQEEYCIPLVAKSDKAEAERDALREALKQCADHIDNYYFEGDKEYQVVILARAALGREGV